MKSTGGPVRAASRALFVGVSCVAALASCNEDPPTGGPDPATEYVFELRFLGPAPTGPGLAAYYQAHASVQATVLSAITGPLPPVALANAFDVADCDSSDPNLEGFPTVPAGTLQGLVVYIHIRQMDGVGGVLGSAGPCLVRSAANGGLPVLGLLKLDLADLESKPADVLERILLHELMHVLGFGTIWADRGVLSKANLADARFLGPEARTACEEAHGGGAECAATVPVHSTDGEGSAYSHWRESFFTNELMTPFLDGGTATPFSEMTIRSMADLGYDVSVAPAQSYVVAAAALRMGGEVADSPDREVTVTRMAEPLRPAFTVDASGRLTPIRKQ